LFDRGGGNVAKASTPTIEEETIETTAEKPVVENVQEPSGFDLSPRSGWSVKIIESSGNEDLDAASWSLAVATHDEDKRQRLGVFISFDIGQLFKKREWQMALEQEMAKVRHRVRQLLTSRRKEEPDDDFHS
jgi:hypothetical protein